MLVIDQAHTQKLRENSGVLGIPENYRADLTDIWWDQLDGTLPDPSRIADLPGGARGKTA